MSRGLRQRAAVYLLIGSSVMGLLGCGAELRITGTVVIPAAAPVRTASSVFFGLPGHPLLDNITQRVVWSLRRDQRMLSGLVAQRQSDTVARQQHRMEQQPQADATGWGF